MSTLTPNSIYDTTYTGSFYAFSGIGGYSTTQGFDTILYQPQTALTSYDVTNAIQVTFDVRTFNTKIGIIKDSSNQFVIDSSLNTDTDSFPNDTITLSAAEFVSGLSVPQVTSVGYYSNMYSDFTNYVSTYFGYIGGFSSLFVNAEDFSYNSNVFDASAFIYLINGAPADGSGSYINDLSGTITIGNINYLLRNAIDSNAFNNRNPSTGTDAADPNNFANYGMADGFKANDLIWVPAGTVITLTLNIDSETFSNAINNAGPTNISSISDSVNGNFATASTATMTNITQVLKAPILIKMANLSTV